MAIGAQSRGNDPATRAAHYCGVATALSCVFDDLIASGSEAQRGAVRATLLRFGVRAVRFAHTGGVRIVPLAPHQSYAACSNAIRKLGVNLDAWPQPPAGLFVVAERTMYVRSTSTMTVAHEFGHALDCVLGAGTYRSSSDRRIATAFASARAFVTPYAASSIDEYFAESVRAYVDANDDASPWPRATPQRLAAIDPAMYAYISELFCTVF